MSNGDTGIFEEVSYPGDSYADYGVNPFDISNIGLPLQSSGGIDDPGLSSADINLYDQSKIVSSNSPITGPSVTSLVSGVGSLFTQILGKPKPATPASVLGATKTQIPASSISQTGSTQWPLLMIIGIIIIGLVVVMK